HYNANSGHAVTVRSLGTYGIAAISLSMRATTRGPVRACLAIAHDRVSARIPPGRLRQNLPVPSSMPLARRGSPALLVDPKIRMKNVVSPVAYPELSRYRWRRVSDYRGEFLTS